MSDDIGEDDEEFDLYSGEFEEIQSDFGRAIDDIKAPLDGLTLQGVQISDLEEAERKVNGALNILIEVANIHEGGTALTDIEIADSSKTSIVSGLRGAEIIMSLFDYDDYSEALNDDGRYEELIEMTVESIKEAAKKLHIPIEKTSQTELEQRQKEFSPHSI